MTTRTIEKMAAKKKSPPPVKASGLRRLLMGCSSPYAVGVAIADLHGLYLGL